MRLRASLETPNFNRRSPRPGPEGAKHHQAPSSIVLAHDLVRRSGQVERDLIAANLDKVEGNRQKAARILGMGERTLYRKLEEHGLT